MISQEEKKILDGVDPWEMYELDRYLSQEIGSRMSGTEGDKKAIEWVSTYFTNQGLKLEHDPFNTLSWDYRGTTFEVGPPLNLLLDSRPAYYS